MKKVTLNRQPMFWNVVDDCYIFLKNLTNNNYESIFDEPILKRYKELYDAYGTVTLMALFYCEGYSKANKDGTWNLSMGTDKYKAEFEANSNWLKFQFHSWAAPVRYRNGYNDYNGEYDYSRPVLSDWKKVKQEAIRCMGSKGWYSEFYIPHFYDLKESDAIDLKREEGVRGLISVTFNNRERKEASFLSLDEFNYLIKTGYVVDDKVGLLHCMRDFAFERISGSLKSFGTPNKVINYLEFYNHPSKNFMNPETHETQIINDNGGIFSISFTTNQSLHSFASWCLRENYQSKFPTLGDFLIQ